jgi:hypothetical protein
MSSQVPIKTVIDLPLSALDTSRTPVLINGLVDPQIVLSESTSVSIPDYKNKKIVIMFYFPECYWCELAMPEYVKAAEANTNPSIVYARFNVVVSGDYHDGTSVWWDAFSTSNFSDSDFCKLLWSMQGTPTWVGYFNGNWSSTLNETGLPGSEDGSNRVASLFQTFANSIGTTVPTQQERFMFFRTRSPAPKERYRRRVAQTKSPNETETYRNRNEFYNGQTVANYVVPNDYKSENKYTKMPAFWIIVISILLLWAIIFLLGKHSKTCKGIHSSVKKMFIL